MKSSKLAIRSCLSFATYLVLASPTAHSGTGDNSPEVYTDNQLSSLYSTMNFGDGLLSCAQRDGTYRFVAQGECGWLDAEVRRLDRDGNSSNIGFEDDSWQLSGGAQRGLNDHWMIGGALSYEDKELTQQGDAGKSDGYQLQLGGVIKRQHLPVVLSLSLSVGYADFDTQRTVQGGSRIDGDQELWMVSSQFRMEHLREFDGWYLSPHLDWGIDFQSAADLSEASAASSGLNLDGKSKTFIYAQPALEIGGDIALGNERILRPRLKVGATRFFSDADPQVETSVDASSIVLTTRTQLDKTYFDAELGVDMFLGSNIVISLNAAGQFSSDTEIYGGNLKIAVPL
ncbi:MAG: autotransporter outer membrane beta-barrel domain-containing protein [Pseudomonadota bacterium]